MTILDEMEAAMERVDNEYPNVTRETILEVKKTLRKYEAVKDRVVVVPREPTASMGIAWNIAAKDTASYFSTEYYKAMIQAAQEGK